MYNSNRIDFVHKEMACLEQISILDFPDEVIEEIMSFLSFSDYFNLRKVERRLEDCAKRVLKKRPFSKCIIVTLIILYQSFYKSVLYEA